MEAAQVPQLTPIETSGVALKEDSMRATSALCEPSSPRHRQLEPLERAPSISPKESEKADNAEMKRNGKLAPLESFHLESTVHDKVLGLMGDEKLNAENRELTGQMECANVKVMQIIGDTHALSLQTKERQLLGDAMTQEQRNEALKADEKEKEIAVKQKRATVVAQNRKVEALLKETNVNDDQTALSGAVDDKALQIMGDSKLEEVNRELKGQMKTANAKAMKLVGDTHALTADSKARKRLGSIMSPEQQRAAKNAEENDLKLAEAAKIAAEKAVEKEAEALASRHLSVENKLEHSANEKVLQMMGDETLVEKSRELTGQMKAANVKAMKLVGDTHALTEDSKARKRLGSMMTPEQMEAAKKAEEEEKRRAEIEKASAAKHAAKEQKKLLQKHIDVDNKLEQSVNSKALKMMGDSSLDKQSRELKDQMKSSNPKAMKLLGDTRSMQMSSKARRKLGSMMSPKQQHMMAMHQQKTCSSLQ